MLQKEWKKAVPAFFLIKWFLKKTNYDGKAVKYKTKNGKSTQHDPGKEGNSEK